MAVPLYPAAVIERIERIGLNALALMALAARARRGLVNRGCSVAAWPLEQTQLAEQT